MSCCKGYTYKCERCKQKFCNKCQASVDDSHCSDCYYYLRGLKAESSSEKKTSRKSVIREVIRLIDAMPVYSDEEEIAAELRWLSQEIDSMAFEASECGSIKDSIVNMLEDRFLSDD